MTTTAWVALGITVFGAFSYGAASILQAMAARRSVGTVRTMGHPLYLAGIACDAAAWVGAMIALQELAVYLVESILASSLAVTVVAARFVLKSHLRRRDVAAVGITITALVVLAMSAGPQHDPMPPGHVRWGLCIAAATVVVVGWAAAKWAPAGAVAATAGLALGGAALVGRSLDIQGGLLGVLTEPLILALLVFAGTGMTLYANALQKGDVGPVTAIHWTAEVVSPSVVALLVLGDSVRPGWGLIALAAGVITVGAAMVLATAPANRDAAHAAAEPLGAAQVAAGVGHAWSTAYVPPASPAPGARRLPTAQPAPALPSATPAMPPLPAPEPAMAEGERYIWWGPPPIWTPPDRTRAELTAAPARPELTWDPPPRVEAIFHDPPADADPVAVPAEQPRFDEPFPAAGAWFDRETDRHRA